jgi:phosphopantothenoylcysteine decarboxylase / phosphopantothenate---cysteine ligase
VPSLKGKSVLLTAGPTYEPIDPVRFIGNHSTGKMGYALAMCFAEAGATVYLISGPTQLQLELPAVEVVPVMTAEQMYQAALRFADQVDVMVFAAAVADYRPKNVSQVKLKKKEEQLHLELVRTIDIAATLGKAKKPGQLVVGFALETDTGTDNARQKLHQKNLDLIVLNSLQDQGAGFKHDTNKISILDHEKTLTFDLKPKTAVAQDIVAEIARRMV